VATDEAQRFPETGRFQVLKRIGAGGMGVVYEALDRERKARVALKTLRWMSADALLRLKTEFRAVQDLQHPNLVGFSELIEEGGQWFLTMELVEGVDFLAHVRPPPDDRFDEARVRAAVAQLAQGLIALHDAQMVHRDLKPANVLVTGEGRVVLLDFGLVVDSAPALGDEGRVKGRYSSMDRAVVGTATYMAPEQAASKPVGPEADWYSLGVMLYEALTGRPPFLGTPIEILIEKQQGEPAPPRSLEPSVPSDLDALCAELLRRDPAARPSGRELLRRLLVGGSPEAPAPIAAQPPFVGRKQELAQLVDAFAARKPGQAVTLFVHGESGVGKSALVRRAVDELAARHPSAVILQGRCFERESVPYKAVDGVIDALSRYMKKLPKEAAAALLPQHAALLSQVFPVLARVPVVAEVPRPARAALDPQELRLRVFHAVRELFARLAERHPVIVMIDDLQWADADSRALLNDLTRQPDAPPLYLVATVRGEASGELPTFGLDGVTHLFLGTLPSEEARELAARLMARAAGEDAASADAVAAEAGGHPLFIDVLVRHVLAHEPHAPGSLRLDDALWSRVEHVDGEARRLLEVIAVAGGPLRQEIAQAASDGATFARSVGLLRAANLVRTAGARGADAVEPYHDRVRETVLAHLTESERQASHQRLALALEGTDRGDAEALSVHWRGAGNREKAARYAERAARQAAQALAFERAARLYRLALELRPHDGAEVTEARAHLRARLGDALAGAGRGAEAAEAYLEAARLPRADVLELQRRAAEQYLKSGRLDEGRAVLETVLGAAGVKIPPTPRAALNALLWCRARIRLRGLGFRERAVAELTPDTLTRMDVCWSAGLGLTPADFMQGGYFTSLHCLMALKAGEPYRVARALAGEAAISSTGGGPTRKRTARLLRAADELARRIQHPHAEALVQVISGVAAWCEGRYRDAFLEGQRSEVMLRERCTGVRWELDQTQMTQMNALYMMGEMAELERRVPLILREAEERGDRYMATSVRISLFTNAAWLVLDDADEARRACEHAVENWPRTTFLLQHVNHLQTRTQVDLYVGDGAGAHQRFSEAWPELKRSLLMRVQPIRIGVLEARARSALAAAERSVEKAALLRAAEADAARIEGERMAWGTPLAKLIRAGIANQRTEREAALRALDEAAAGFKAAHMALYREAARWRKGQLIGGDEGQAMIDHARGFMREQRIRAPGRMTAMLAPGFLDW